MEKYREQMIWNYFDGHLSESELEEFEVLKKTDSNFTQDLEEFGKIHHALKLTKLDQINFDLSDKVFAKIHTPALNNYSGIGIKPLFVFITGLLIFCILSLKWYDPAAAQIIPNINKYITFNLPDFSLSLPDLGSYGLYVTLTLIVIPGLYFLDRAIQKRSDLRLNILPLI